MKNEKDDLIYDDDEAVKFIFSSLPEHLQKKYTIDDVDYFLDILYEYYEKNGLLDEESEEEVELDEDEMLAYVCKCIKKDKECTLNPDDMPYFLDGEFKYCESIGIIND